MSSYSITLRTPDGTEEVIECADDKYILLEELISFSQPKPLGIASNLKLFFFYFS